MSPKIDVLLGACLFLAACGGQYRELRIHTSPEGAQLFVASGGTRGKAPTTLYYDEAELEQHRNADGCFQVEEIAALWASGASASTGQLYLCNDRRGWTLTLERPHGAPGLEADLAAAETRYKELELQALEEQIRRAQGEAAMAEGIGALTQGLTCYAAGGCSDESTSSYFDPYEPPRGYGSAYEPYDNLPPSRDHDSLRLAPDGSYVMGEPRLCPDGRYVGGGSCTMAPDGSYLSGPSRLSPDGSYVNGPPTLCPDGSYVGGTRCVLAPDGTYVGSY